MSILHPSDLTSIFWKMHRHHDLKYYLNLPQILAQTDHQLSTHPPKCKFCKSLPIHISTTSNTEPNQCKLCGSINTLSLQLQPTPPLKDNNWYTHQSYTFPIPNRVPLETLTIIAIDPWIQQSVLQLLYQSLTAITDHATRNVSIVIPVGDLLALLDLSDDQQQPQLTYLTSHINFKQIIANHKTILQSNHVQQLQTIISAIQQQKMPSFNSLPTILKLISTYNEQDFNSITFTQLLWIGPLPLAFTPAPPSSIYTTAVFLTNSKDHHPGTLIDLRLSFNQTFILHGQDRATQLYYQIYQLLSDRTPVYFIRKNPQIHSNIPYSGTLRTFINGIITSRSPILQIATANDNPHTFQLQLQYFDQTQKKWLMLVANFNDRGPFRCQPFQKSTLASKTIEFILQKYIKQTQTQKKLISSFDFSFILLAIEEYSATIQCATNYMQGILHHIKQYFKQFQKNAIMVYRPFQHHNQLNLLPLFWPILAGNSLIHYGQYYFCQQLLEEELEQVNQVLGRFYTPREHKLPYFYRTCLQNSQTNHLKIEM